MPSQTISSPCRVGPKQKDTIFSIMNWRERRQEPAVARTVRTTINQILTEWVETAKGPSLTYFCRLDPPVSLPLLTSLTISNKISKCAKTRDTKSRQQRDQCSYATYPAKPDGQRIAVISRPRTFALKALGVEMTAKPRRPKHRPSSTSTTVSTHHPYPAYYTNVTISPRASHPSIPPLASTLVPSIHHCSKSSPLRWYARYPG